MGSWKVTIRDGSDVGREKFGSLDEAMAEAKRQVEGILSEERRLQTVHFLREFTPDQQVNARIEISGPGLIRTKEAGLDVMGDGGVIAYTGAIRKEPIEADSLEHAFARLQEELAQG